jgi:uncharacterized protein YlxP (DUF503 family)
MQSATTEKPRRGPWTVDQYMALEIERRTELLGGFIHDVSPKNAPHTRAVRALNRALADGLDQRFELSVQDPIAVGGWHGHDAPEIDIAVITAREYETAPTASEALAFIEVSDTTYRGKHGDRTYKIPLYVAAGVPSWIVNIPLRQVEFYGSVADLELEHGHVFDEHAAVDILGVVIPVARLFAPRPKRA